MLIQRAQGWRIPASEATDETVFMNRRAFLAKVGATAVTTIAGPVFASACRGAVPATNGAAIGPLTNIQTGSPNLDLYPPHRNTAYTLDRPLTDEVVAATYNNFYEFTTAKEKVWRLAAKLQTRPWTLEVSGLVAKPKVFDVDALVRSLGIQERLYRHRCVEAWAMAVPWSGFPLAELIKNVAPTSRAKFVRFESFLDPGTAPGQKDHAFHWPYYEGLSMAEATNELTFLASGIYGHELPKQHGAPLRLVVPWKYGFKSIKSITKIEFVDKQPHTLWSDAVPEEYDFVANVRPDIPHRRWSQASERMIGSGKRRPTLRYNGYAEQVAHLYA